MTTKRVISELRIRLKRARETLKKTRKVKTAEHAKGRILELELAISLLTYARENE